MGEWRTIEVFPIDSVGIVTDGTRVEGIKGLRDLAVRKHQMFEEVVTENLLTYAIGRGLDYKDMPLVRSLVHDVAKDNYRHTADHGCGPESGLHQNMKSAPVSLSAANSMKGE